MLTKVEAVNTRGDVLQLPLYDVSGGIVVENVDGLGPAKASYSSTRMAGRDGARKQAGRRDIRNIVLTLGLEPDYGVTTVADLRNGLYAFFMTNTDVTLRFFIDGVHHSSIEASVETCEPAIFSRDPQMIVSLLCHSPAFVAPTEVVAQGTTRSNNEYWYANNPGNMETEFVFQHVLNTVTTGMTLGVSNVTYGYKSLALTGLSSAGLQVGDILEISTVSGNRGMWRVRGTSRVSLLSYMGVYRDLDMKLQPGPNNGFRVYQGTAVNPISLTFTPKYGGL